REGRFMSGWSAVFKDWACEDAGTTATQITQPTTPSQMMLREPLVRMPATSAGSLVPFQLSAPDFCRTVFRGSFGRTPPDCDYRMTLTLPPETNGCVGAAPEMSCQIVPGSSVANPRMPVDPTVNGTAVA